MRFKQVLRKSMCSLTCAAMLAVSTLTFSGCGDNKTIEDKRYETYGLLSSNDVKDPKIEYELIVGNLVWGIILFETIVAPVYFFGFSLFEPVGKK